jgi:hypothetical protein
MRLERIPEEDQHVDLAIGDPGADLLVAAERAAAQAGHRQPEFGHEEVTGRASRAQVVPASSPRLNRAHSARSLFLLSCAIRAILRLTGYSGWSAVRPGCRTDVSVRRTPDCRRVSVRTALLAAARRPEVAGAATVAYDAQAGTLHAGVRRPRSGRPPGSMTQDESHDRERRHLA